MLPERHLILCGFMACGKSTVGALLADAVHRPFIDTDTLVEQQAGMNIPELFAARGEAAFRDLEHETVLRLPRLSPAVVATGGGLPTFARNVAPLREAGTVLFIERPFEAIWAALSTREGRPLASGRSREEMQALYERRLPLYRACAHFTVPNRGTADACVRAILDALQ